MTRLQQTLQAAAAGAALLLLAAASHAQAPNLAWNDAMMKAADVNTDGMVSRVEFQDHMGLVWDRHHANMMKGNPKMKHGMMEAGQWREFSGTLMKDPGKIGGN